jgi:hypothetical protein
VVELRPTHNNQIITIVAIEELFNNKTLITPEAITTAHIQVAHPTTMEVEREAIIIIVTIITLVADHRVLLTHHHVLVEVFQVAVVEATLAVQVVEDHAADNPYLTFNK